MKNTKRYTFFLLLTAVIFAGCSSSAAPDEASSNQAQPDDRSAVRVETMAAEPTTFEDEIRLTGNISAPEDATLSAQSSGTLTSLKPLGSYVKAGEIVAQVNPNLAQAALKQAEAQVSAARTRFELAKDNLGRQEALRQDTIISALEFQNIQAQYGEAEASLEQAEAARVQAEEQLANTGVTAPFAGTVEEHLADRGEQVNAGSQVARLVSSGQLRVEAGVPERYAGDIGVGTSVTVHLGNYGMESVTGQVAFAGAAINPQSRTFPIEVAIANPDGRLKPEMTAQLAVTRRTFEDVLVVPQDAVVRDEGGQSLFVVAQADTAGGNALTARRLDVRLGAASNGRVVVTGGLEAGERVVVLGQNSLAEGDPVEVVGGTSAAGDQLSAADPESQNQ